MNKILIVTPTYNEIANIALLIDTILDEYPHVDLLVVDDSSPDGTGECVSQHKLFSNRLFLISRPGKMGLGSAYCDAFKWALSYNYDKIIQIDADFSHNPKYLSEMIKVSNDFDLVIGSRYINGVNVVNWPMSRLLLSYLANLYCKVILGINIKDFTGGFKCFNRKVLESIDLKKVKSEGYSFQVEINLKAFLNNMTIKEIPIIFNDRACGTSKMSKKVIFEAIYMVPLLKLKNIFRIL
jgi:dolichol-phosphate mannosyltransferase